VKVVYCLLIFGLAGILTARVVPDRYVVELTGEPVAASAARQGRRSDLRGPAARERRARLHEEHRAMRARVQQENAEVLDSIETVANALVVRVSEARAARLARLPGVARIHPVREFKMLLDRAVAVHKVTDAWAQIGEDRAGSGVKIAVIDSGVDIEHPGMNGASFTMPEGFPRVNADSDLAFTNPKVIVARSYVSLLPRRDSDISARDRVGHGTALAMAAGGVTNAGPLATITGVAPRAYIGNYKVFGSPGVNDSASDDAILKAIDDAVADGMDVINLSLGTDVAERPQDDILVQAIERASTLGVVVVVSAGNNGPDPMTIASPATAPSAIAVGASLNDRVFSASATVGATRYLALPSSGARSSPEVSGLLADVAAFDQTGLACDSLPDGSLMGRIAFVLRGVCTFEQKLTVVQRAGAIGALVYTDAERPAVEMSVGSATLPAEMISFANGGEIKQRLPNEPQIQATLRFELGAVPSNPDGLASFSARGPNVDTSIKPDIVAVGTSFYTATQRLDSSGDMYDPSGYISVQGTSFSAPIVAGAAALLKSARPGLTTTQYRSLLINTAGAISADTLTPAHIQQAGAGILDVRAALNGAIAALPTAVNFGAGGVDPQLSRTLTISNLSGSAETYVLSTVARDNTIAPFVSTSALTLDPGGSAEIRVDLIGPLAGGGTYEGFVRIQGSNTQTEARVPYWYAAATGVPQTISILSTSTGARRGSSLNDAIVFRVTDVSGIPFDLPTPAVTALSGGGEVLSVISEDSSITGAYGVRVRLGAAAGANTFRIQAGDVTRDVTITAR
jgi:subtilisin family serine protease